MREPCIRHLLKTWIYYNAQWNHRVRFSLWVLAFHFKQLWPERGGGVLSATLLSWSPFGKNRWNRREGRRWRDGMKGEKWVLSNYAVWLKGSYTVCAKNQDVVNPENTLGTGGGGIGGGSAGGTQGGFDCPACLLMLIIFCLPLIIQRPGVLPVMKTLNHKVYI